MNGGKERELSDFVLQEVSKPITRNERMRQQIALWKAQAAAQKGNK